jgi:hypothetical protein
MPALQIFSPPTTHTSSTFAIKHPLRLEYSSQLVRNIGTFSALEIAIFLRVILAVTHTRKLKENLPVIAFCNANLGRYPRGIGHLLEPHKSY